VYFLFVSILVCMPFSPTMASSTAVPFACVLLWTALKDMYEDLRRRRDDEAENSRLCWRYDAATSSFVNVQWRQVLVGDIVLSFQDEAFPADMVIVGAAGGQAFISTANLDGETNLKERRAVDVCSIFAQCLPAEKVGKMEQAEVRSRAGLIVDLLLQQQFQAALDEPKVGPTNYGGTAQLNAVSESVRQTMSYQKVDSKILMNFEHFVPRGCLLRNTPWLLSVAAYVGDESKARLGVGLPAAKISNLQVQLNSCVKGLLCLLCTVCIYAAIMGRAMGDDDSGDDFFVRFLIYWIILYQIVPISLYVCFEVLKLILGFQINSDPMMVYEPTGQGALARTADLVEELGEVQHIFSDKTGTLTQNEMRFARCCILGKDLGDFRPVEPTPRISASSGSRSASKEAVEDGVAEARRIMAHADDQLYEETQRFFLCLALCHDVQVETGEEDGKLRYSGSSPDEVAFLEATQQVGMALRARRPTPGSSGAVLEIEGPAGNMRVAVICQVPFSSDRKRMTVVCEHFDGRILCITKGADNVMGSLCEGGAIGESSLQCIDSYARLGLRTLVIAWKELDHKFFEDWRTRFEAAKSLGVDEREQRMAVCAAELEHSLKFCGISAIEDRLQDGVPQAIAMLKAMGIRMWVLTGDKTETAVEIARSCSLISPDMEIVYLVGCTSTEEAVRCLQQNLDNLRKSTPAGGTALVLDGSLVQSVLASEDAKALLHKLALISLSCVCCRLAPQQKRALVQIIKDRDSSVITLAVGDGANDVPMIQGAHVGVAVRGKEGCQAVQASDITISQFRFLVPLLHCHGRRAYRRVATFLCYYVYKHIVLAFGDILWAHQRAFAGEIAYAEWLSSAYSWSFWGSIETSATILPWSILSCTLRVRSTCTSTPWSSALGLQVGSGMAPWHGSCRTCS